jgi:small conductance mechanosensitive channel
MMQVAIDVGTRFGIRIVGAIALWIVGRAVINFCGRLIKRGLVNQHIDPTLGRYVASAVSIALNVVLVIAVLGIFGVETTTFAAVIAAAGVAIGIAWGGMLGNFAAGVFLVIFRPFKTGDFVSAGGVTGTVHEIGMCASSIDTPDNVRTIIGNNKIVSDTIQNFSANPYRRVDLTAQLAHGVDVRDAVAMLKDRIAKPLVDAARPRRGDSPVHPGRPRARRPAVLQQRALLAGLLRHQPDDPRLVRLRAVSGARAALPSPEPRRLIHCWPR